MMPNKLLLPAILLLSAPMTVFAAAPAGAGAIPAGAASKVASVQQAATAERANSDRVYADNTSQHIDNTTYCSRPSSSFYAGLGISIQNDKGATDLMPKAYVGYGNFFGKSRLFYGAVEVSGGAGSIALSPNQDYRVGHLIAASIIPGYRLNDWTMFYARLGAQSTRYSNLNETRSSALYGIGIEAISTSHWDARFEYDYANNKNLNQFGVDAIYKFK